MKRIAGNIWNTILGSFQKDSKKATESYERYYSPGPRDMQSSSPRNSREEESDRYAGRTNEMERAYAGSSRAAEIQYC